MSSRTISREILRAAWLAPMAGSFPSPGTPAFVHLFQNAAVLVENGIIQDLGPARQLLAGHPDVPVRDLGNAIILPGLVNAHTHLELSDCQVGDPPTGGFASWLAGMLMRAGLEPLAMERAVKAAVGIGIQQCLAFGVTAVGDISRLSSITRPLLKESPLRVVSYGEVAAMAQRRGLLEQRLTAAADDSLAGPRLAIGITPHAPYSIEPSGYRRCLEVARAHNMPLATHLAETGEESQFLESHSGPLRELWDKWLCWDEDVPKFAGGPIRYARELGLLEYPTLLAHVNFCDDEELEILALGKASVVYCPRTHDYFGHPPHRWREMLAKGINVAVGTDSCASSPDLNLVDDLRLVHRKFPEEPVETLWEMATVRAARAIGRADAGIIRVGAPADLVAFAVRSNDPLKEILEDSILPMNTLVGGKSG